MKIIFVTDLHGDEWKYNRVLEIARELKAAAVINCGDMLPKGKRILEQGDFIGNYLDSHFAEFNAAGIHSLCYLGNDDLAAYDDIFEKTCSKYPYIHNIAQRKLTIKQYEFIGMNLVDDYPFLLKDRCRRDTEDYEFPMQYGKGLLSTPMGLREIRDWFSYARTLHTIEQEMDRLPKPKNMAKSVYVIHMPPYKLGLDRCAHGEEVGSKAIYDFIVKHQPLLSLHGHIHESPELTGKWRAELGKTICVQPGQSNTGLTYVVIDLITMEMERIHVDRDK